jgi:hypothetical protein
MNALAAEFARIPSRGSACCVGILANSDTGSNSWVAFSHCQNLVIVGLKLAGVRQEVRNILGHGLE